MKTVIWDWNGTLLDDVAYAVGLENEILEPMGFRHVEMDYYLTCFRFPVINYYRALGVPDELYTPIADEWNRRYDEGFSRVSLRPDAMGALERLRLAGVRQVIISASRADKLRDQVAQFPGLPAYFDSLNGTGDIYAAGKAALAERWMRETGTRPEDCLFIGDTDHDAEVAAAIRVPALLVLGGHQDEATLRRACPEPAASLKEAADRVLRRFGLPLHFKQPAPPLPH